MKTITENIQKIKNELPKHVTLVAVSKTKPIENIIEAYESGQRIFGENKVQEMVEKQEALPKDIQWHMIGHLQRNKVKYIASFVDLIHGVDSFKLLQEIDKQGKRNNRIISCLLQIFIAEEDTKFGLNQEELNQMLSDEAFQDLNNIKIVGLMGMATFTEDTNKIKREFTFLKDIYEQTREKYVNLEQLNLQTLSMGMSNDYPIAIECGSTMVRIGSHIFGIRNH
ncbi:YggS family pyridoxal phosphate-dependent enzyme [Myroides guanonis]|uniref:Pyridoxal phosphate homeostasis protein n=1 Tax=Myroides guanonis TaxID=1150112 RepID=A0A1I3KNH3_9FLAO|nr:YggS family pyridoxal phosphate-dependent enzyme [Myroides guanonis]SFI74049.1 hypothetical protein SAMN04487893_1019 [Myroides guanonis]